MIIFSWTLTPNQIAALKSVAESQAIEDAAIRDKKKVPDFIRMGHGIQNWIGATKGLFREGFIRVIEVPVSKLDAVQFSSKTRPKWEITEKGLVMLRLVSIEIEQQRATLENDMKVVKQLQIAG